MSNRQAAGSASSNVAVRRDPVLEQVEHPDRQDDVAEDRADEAARAGDQRQQERRVEAGRPARPRLDAGDDASIQSRIAAGICSRA